MPITVDDAMTHIVDAPYTWAALEFAEALSTKKLRKLADLLYLETGGLKRAHLEAIVVVYARL